MHDSQRFPHCGNAVDGLVFWQRSALPQYPGEGLPFEILHHYIGGVVLLERRIDVNNPWVLELGEHVRFFQELHLRTLIVGGSHYTCGHHCVAPARRAAMREVFLNRYGALEACIAPQIGDAEPTLPEDLADSKRPPCSLVPPARVLPAVDGMLALNGAPQA